MSAHQYCSGCMATVKEIERRINKRRLTKENRESKVMSIIEEICAANNFLEYEYSPPKTVRACKALIDEFEEDIEKAFVKDKSNRLNLICHEITNACEGVDMSLTRTAKDTADIDLSGEGDDRVVTKAVKFNPETGAVEPEKKPVKEGKTLSKSKRRKDKKKKDKLVSGRKGETSRNEKKKMEDEHKPGTKKGSIHHLNLDLNDKEAMAKIIKQIQDIKDEL